MLVGHAFHMGVPKVWELLIHIERQFRTVAESVPQREQRMEGIQWISHAHDHFVRVEVDRVGHVHRVVGFYHPNALISDIFAPHAEHLLHRYWWEWHVGTSLDTGDELEILAEASVPRTRESSIGDSLTGGQDFTVEEASLAV